MYYPNSKQEINDQICKIFRLLQQTLCEFQKIEKRERLDAIFRERETRRKETQQR